MCIFNFHVSLPLKIISSFQYLIEYSELNMPHFQYFSVYANKHQYLHYFILISYKNSQYSHMFILKPLYYTVVIVTNKKNHNIEENTDRSNRILMKSVKTFVLWDNLYCHSTAKLQNHSNS